MAPRRHIQIFLSSPGDVADEREIARDLIKDVLPVTPFIRGRLTFDVISWDDPHAAPGLPAHLTPQEAINRKLPKPSDCDIVIVILWSRMGTPLPPDVTRDDGSTYQSGTEWEFEDALDAANANESGKPTILLYRRTEEPQIGLGDPEFEAKREQYRKVEAFFARFKGAGGSLTGTVHSYPTADEFRELLRQNLESVVSGFLGDEVRGAQQPTIDSEALQLAKAKLSGMPIDEVPEVTSLPAGSHMPWPADQAFVGRQEDLKRLAGILKGTDTAAIGQIAAATGLGGIGKTQLASAFAHRYGQYFAGGVHWLSLADRAAVPAEIATCGAKMFPDAGFTQKPLEEQIALVLGAWQSAMPRLLVFDNCEEEDLFKAWRPPTGGARVLVTSRRAHWSPSLGIKDLALGALAREESVALLRKHRPELDEEDPELNAIAELLGDLPFALHLAGSFLERYRFAAFGQPGAYVAELRRPYPLEHRSLIGGGDSPTEHEQHVGRTFERSYQGLDGADEVDGQALDLLARASCLAPGQPIPRALLLATAGDEGGSDPMQLEDALGRLSALGLLQQEADGSLVLHRLLALFVRHRVDDLSVAEDTVEATVQAEASRLNWEGYPGPLLMWQGHLRHVAEAAAERDSEAAGGLQNELGYHLDMVADYAGAKTAHERALKIDEATYGPDHPNVARDVNNLGMILQEQGDYAGAKAAYERALTIFETVLGADHPSTQTVRDNLASVGTY